MAKFDLRYVVILGRSTAKWDLFFLITRSVPVPELNLSLDMHHEKILDKKILHIEITLHYIKKENKTFEREWNKMRVFQRPQDKMVDCSDWNEAATRQCYKKNLTRRIFNNCVSIANILKEDGPYFPSDEGKVCAFQTPGSQRFLLWRKRALVFKMGAIVTMKG